MAAKIDYFSADALRHDLKGKAVRGGIYTASGQVGQATIQVAALPILGRLLAPEDFGLVAMVAVVTNFAAMFVDAGLSTATIQHEKITHAQVTNLFWVAAGLGCGVALIVAALAPGIAWFYGEPRLVVVTLALTTSFVGAGLTLQHQALLRRAMRFRALAVVQIVSAIIGQGIAVAVAWHYRSYWALVWIPIGTAMARMVGTWTVCGWRPGWPKRGTNVRPMIGFGAYLIAFNVVNYFSRNVDHMLIGWYWGPTPLGFYDRAYQLVLKPLTQVSGPMSYVALPSLSRLADDPARYRSFWRKGCSIAAFILVPFVACAILVAPELVLTLLGPQWKETIPVFWALTPAMAMSFSAPVTWVFVSWGRPDKQFIASLLIFAVTMVGFAIALPFGIIAVAWSFSITQCLVRLPLIMYCFAGTPLRLSDLWEAVRSSLYTSVVAAAVALAVFAVTPFPAAAPFALVLKSAVFALPYALLSIATSQGRYIWGELQTVVLSAMRRRSLS